MTVTCNDFQHDPTHRKLQMSNGHQRELKLAYGNLTHSRQTAEITITDCNNNWQIYGLNFEDMKALRDTLTQIIDEIIVEHTAHG